jgi:hypothetical protein
MKTMLLLWLLPTLALADGERHVPRGELTPQVIEKAFDSPVGEVEFTSVGSSGHSAMLRNVKGRVMGFTEVRGSQDCETWFMSDKASELPRNCQFFFYDENSGRTLEVRGDELEESSLFDVASGELRGRADVAL